MTKKKTIPKNRSDQEMLVGFEEVKESSTQQSPQDKDSKSTNSFASFFSSDLQEQIELYKEGIVDFDLKVKTVENEIILTPKPKRKVKKV
jgi:hypothetical protein